MPRRWPLRGHAARRAPPVPTTSQATGDGYLAANAGIPVAGLLTIENLDLANKRVTVSAGGAVPALPHVAGRHRRGSELDDRANSRDRGVGSGDLGHRRAVRDRRVHGAHEWKRKRGRHPHRQRPVRGSVPGGFGWLDDGTESCVKDVTSWTSPRSRPATPANAHLTDAELTAAADQLKCSLASVPNKYKTNIEKLFYCFVGRTVLVPVLASRANAPGRSPPGRRTASPSSRLSRSRASM